MDHPKKKVSFKMKIIIPTKVFEKIMFWVNKAEFEVSGFGKCSFNGMDFEVTDAVLLKQKGGHAHTDIEPESLSRVQYLLRDQPGELRFWWHSHVNMNSYMSSTDESTLKELGSQGWAIATVFNKRREVTSAVSYRYNTPFGANNTFYDATLATVIQFPDMEENEVEKLTAEYDKNVEREVYKPPALYSQSGSAYNGRFDEYDAMDDEITIYETEAAEALRVSVFVYRSWVEGAGPEELAMFQAEIDAYWVEKRGSAPFDITKYMKSREVSNDHY